MGKAMLRVAVVMAALVALPMAAMAGVTATYDGSFKVLAGYYGEGLAYVPDGVGNADRPTPVQGPTVLSIGKHSLTDYIKEWYIPALVTSGTPITATQVPTASGGTFVDNVTVLGGAGCSSSMTVMGGEIWALRQAGSYGSNAGIGLMKMGSNETWNGGTGVSRVQPYGMPTGSQYTGGGLCDKWDETDTLLMHNWHYATGGQRIWVSKHVKGPPPGADPNVFSWTATEVFNFFSADSAYRSCTLEYIQVGGTKYYVMSVWKQNACELMFFDAATATGSDVAPDFTIPVTDDITNGVGWIRTSGDGSAIKDLAWDGVSKLYLYDTPGGSVQHAYAHVFTLAEEVLPIPEPAGLGLVGLALLALKRRRS